MSFSAALDRRMGNYLETSFAIETRRSPRSFQLECRNLLDSRGDSFAYGNPLRIFSREQFVRQEPLSIRLSATFSR